jgi:hypothetical protein
MVAGGAVDRCEPGDESRLFYSPPTRPNVLVDTDNTGFVGRSPATGQEQWRLARPGQDRLDWSVAAYNGDALLVAAWPGGMAGFDPATGALVWEQPQGYVYPHEFWWTTTVEFLTNGSVVVVDSGGADGSRRVRLLNPADGEVAWSVENSAWYNLDDGLLRAGPGYLAITPERLDRLERWDLVDSGSVGASG